jgi:hypothetical protein
MSGDGLARPHWCSEVSGFCVNIPSQRDESDIEIILDSAGDREAMSKEQAFRNEDNAFLPLRRR